MNDNLKALGTLAVAAGACAALFLWPYAALLTRVLL